MTRGKLIILEGTDGSGKGTQFTLLIDYLTKNNIAYETMDFPRYGKSFFGDLAGQMLAGDFGTTDTIAPELAVLPFACDRWLLKDELNRWLDQGKLVISNRYTASSAVYHAAKLPKDKQHGFIDWLYKLEQEVIGLPKEDVAMYFHVPATLSQKLVENKDARTYLGDKKKDIYELDSQMQETVERLYLELATHRSGWKTIECMDGETLRSRESIHKDILDVLTANAVL
jgi:dTMP kinase